MQRARLVLRAQMAQEARLARLARLRAAGAMGNDGTQGPTGPIGPEGPQGPAGQDGGGGGGGLTVAGINALTEIGADEIHSNDNLPGTATVGGLAVLRKFSLSRITNFLRSSVGLGKELVPEAAPAHSGRIPIVNAGGTGYQLALYPNVIAGTPTLSRLPGGVPAVTDRWVRIISPYHQGVPDSFTLTVGFSPDGMLAGYNRLGSEEFGSIAFNQADVLPPFVNVLGTAVSTDDYGIDSDVQFYSKSDAEEWNWLRVDNRDYLFGDVLFDTGWFRRITNGPRFTGGETTLELNLIRADGSAFQNLPSTEDASIDAGEYQYDYDAGEWQLFVPDAASHVDTPGAPSGEPGKYQYITVNRSGDVYPTQQITTHSEVEATGVSEEFTNARYVRSPASLAVLFSEAGSWGIWFPDDATGRATQSGLNIGTVFYNQTWYDAWNRLVEATTDVTMLATFTALRDAVDLGRSQQRLPSRSAHDADWRNCCRLPAARLLLHSPRTRPDLRHSPHDGVHPGHEYHKHRAFICWPVG